MADTAQSRSPWLTRERQVLIGLLLFTAVVHGGVLWGMRGNLQQDPDAYREIAENVLQHGVFGRGQWVPPDYDPFAVNPLTPTAYRPPLYPIVLSNLPAADGKHVSLWKVAVLHVLLGVASVWLTYLTARRLSSPTFHVGQAAATTLPPASNVSADKRRRWQRLAHTECGPTLAALFVACDPILLNQQTLVMTETLATLLAILSLWCLVRFSSHRYWWNAALAGGAIGLAALCRPTFLPWLGLVGVAMVADSGLRIADWRTRGPRSLANFVALAIAAAAVMSPWVIRNQREFGKPILTTTHGGYTLWLGNNPRFYKHLKSDRSGLPWDVNDHTAPSIDELNFEFSLFDLPPELREFAHDANYQQRAVATMKANLADCLRACLYRILQLWSPLPHKLTADESTGRLLLRWLTAAWYCGVYLLAAVGVWRLRWRLLRQPWVWGVLLCLAFTAVHTLYWCNLRMRAPLVPFVALVAAAGMGPTKRLSE